MGYYIGLIYYFENHFKPCFLRHFAGLLIRELENSLLDVTNNLQNNYLKKSIGIFSDANHATFPSIGVCTSPISESDTSLLC